MSESVSRSGPDQTPRRTPIQSRSYLNMPHGIHQSPHNNSGTHTPHMIQETNSVVSEDTGVIYGTNISTKYVITALQQFVQQFTVTRISDGDTVTEKIYYTQLTELDLLQTNTFDVQGIHLKEYNKQLYYQFIYFPAEMISCFDFVLKNLYQRFFMTQENDQSRLQEKQSKRDKLMMGIRHLDDITFMRNLIPKDINKLICFRGIVIRSSEIYPEMKIALFRCTNCQAEVQVILENAKVQEPTVCKNCKLKGTQQIIHNLCEFTDKQFIKFQQLPEYVPQGQTPNALTILCYDSNVDGMRPGDRVQIVGIYRAQPIKVQRGRTNLKSVFNTYIDLISFKIMEDNRFKASLDNQQTVFNDDDKIQFAKMADSDQIVNNLVASFAPSIYGNQDVKKGILAQLFGGTKKLNSEGKARFRSDINIILVGDPSTAKSQMLQQVYKIAPRGIYTSGRGSSAVGLTANVRKDPQTRQFILESGALVLSDLGICCIDEFDKMDNNSRTILLQAMQQQTISIAKAGIVCQLNSRTAILAAANPVNSRYNPKKSVIENINLSPALLSRFDLIYIMLDKPNEIYDRKLASHMLNIYSNKEKNQINPGFYSRDMLARYITYAKEYVHPVLSDQAGRKIGKAYLEMRKLGNNKKVITATPRQLESLIRMSQSFAKMRLSNEVNEDDVDQAINLIKVATQQAATDPTTGLIDMDIIVTGKTAASRQKIDKIADKVEQIIRANLSKYKKSSNIDHLLPEVERQWEMNEPISEKQLIESLKKLENKGTIVLFGQNKKKPNFKLAKDLYDY